MIIIMNILYICDKVGSVYKTEEENTNTDSINILDDQVEHELFGLHYIFSYPSTTNP